MSCFDYFSKIEGVEEGTPSILPCHSCRSKSAVAVVLQDDVGYWVRCTACQWEGDLFQHASNFVRSQQSQSDEPLSTDECIKHLRSLGVKFRRGCTAKRVTQSYLRHVKARQAFLNLQAAMKKRAVSKINTPAVAYYNLQLNPHVADMWWCASPAEVNSYLFRHTDNETHFARTAGCITGEDRQIPTVVAPYFDAIDRLVAVALPAWNQFNSWVTRCLPAGGSGVAFRRAAGFKCAAWGDEGKICTEPAVPLLMQAHNASSNISLLPMVAVIDPSTPREVASIKKNLPRKNWTILHTPEAPVSTYYFARTLNVDLERVEPVDLRNRRFNRVIRRTWVESMAERTLQHLRSGSTQKEVLIKSSPFGQWTDDVIERVGKYLPKMEYDDLKLLLAKTVHHRRARVSPEVTIVETPAGWLWDEQQQIVATTYPVNVQAYTRGRKVRHKGEVCVTHNGKIVALVPFDSGRFRKDPVAVMETAVMRKSLEDGRLSRDYCKEPEPIIANHVARIAMFFSR